MLAKNNKESLFDINLEIEKTEKKMKKLISKLEYTKGIIDNYNDIDNFPFNEFNEGRSSIYKSQSQSQSPNKKSILKKSPIKKNLNLNNNQSHYQLQFEKQNLFTIFNIIEKERIRLEIISKTVFESIQFKEKQILYYKNSIEVLENS